MATLFCLCTFAGHTLSAPRRFHSDRVLSVKTSVRDTVTELPPNAESAASEVIAARPVLYASAPAAPGPLDLSCLLRRNAALDLALLLVVALLIPFGFDLAAALSFPEAVDLSFSFLVIVRKWFDALLLVALTAYFVYRQRVPAAAFGLQRDRLGVQALWALPTLLAIYVVFMVFMVVIGVVLMFYPELQKDLIRRVDFMEMLPLNDVTTAVLLLIPVAIHEELLFRGLLLPYLHRVGCSWGLAVFLSSAVFAALHLTQGWLGVLQVFGVGAVLGAFFVLTRSALAVMLAHFLFNFIQLQLARVLMPWLERFVHEVGVG